MKTGEDYVKVQSDTTKWKNATESVRMSYFAISKYLVEKYGEEELSDFIKSGIEITEELLMGGVTRLLAKTVSKLSKPLLMKELVKNVIDSFQFEIPPKNYKIEEFEDKTIVEITKCPSRKNFNKYAKKTAPNLIDKICQWDILAGERVKEFGIEQTIDLTEKGCIITFKIIK